MMMVLVLHQMVFTIVRQQQRQQEVHLFMKVQLFSQLRNQLPQQSRQSQNSVRRKKRRQRIRLRRVRHAKFVPRVVLRRAVSDGAFDRLRRSKRKRDRGVRFSALAFTPVSRSATPLRRSRVLPRTPFGGERVAGHGKHKNASAHGRRR